MSLLRDRRQNMINEKKPKAEKQVEITKPIKMTKTDKIEHEKNIKLESINYIISSINEPDKDMNGNKLLEIVNSFVDKFYSE